MRFAFLTTEFPTTKPGGGGLASYVARMTRLLAEAGHGVDIFVPVTGAGGVQDWQGCRLHHVAPARSLAGRLQGRLWRLAGQTARASRGYFLSQADALAAAVERRHAEQPYDVVHSADHRGIGLGLRPRPGRLSVVRCSAAMDLYMASDGRRDGVAAMQVALEEAAVRQADFAFAPSQLTAAHYSRTLGRHVAVLRPPVYAEFPATLPPPNPATPAPNGLPPRYLLHFAASLIARKGTDLIAEALPLALALAPDLTMVWAGRQDPATRAALLAPLGARAAQVIWVPAQDKAGLYALIRGAVCSVLPSRIDNLPNTVLESLMLGVPVIGSRDSSIDELVEDGVTGCLVANGSAEDLAHAMVKAWSGQLNLTQGPNWADSAKGQAFRPEVALQAYLAAITAAQGQPKGTTT